MDGPSNVSLDPAFLLPLPLGEGWGEGFSRPRLIERSSLWKHNSDKKPASPYAAPSPLTPLPVGEGNSSYLFPASARALRPGISAFQFFFHSSQKSFDRLVDASLERRA